jgi:DNA-binding SARP family transcriptional activator/predicted ATPase
MKRLNLYLMGTPRIELAGQPISIERQKAVALLAYLAITERGHSRDWLAALLWPDVETSRTQLRIALSVLRHRLGDDWFDGSRGEVGLRGDDIWTDVGQIKTTAARQTAKRLSAAEVDEVVRLYQFDLLAGFSLPDAPSYDAWQWAEEEKLRSAFEQLLRRHVQAQIAHGESAQAIPYAKRLVELDPLNEDFRRLLIQLYVDTNQRHNALLEYQSTQAALMNGLGLEPEPATQALYERIQQSITSPARLEPQLKLFSQAILPIREPLIGREKELETLVGAFANHERLITISGPSGIGKTHLAVMLGHRIAEEFRDGSLFISFPSPITAAGLLEMLSRVFQAPPLPVGDMLGSLVMSVQSRRSLVILDNFDPLEGASDVIQALLETAPHISFIVTSQGSLSLKQEFCFPLQGLPVDASQQPTDEFVGAVQLFIHTAQHVNPAFPVDTTSLNGIRRICSLTNGMPLAIILAAAWCDVLQASEIADEIAASYDFLRTDYLDVPERHRSMRAVLDAVWARLSAEEQQGLLRLSVFRGSFSRHAAQHVSQVSVALLKQIVAKSLISYSGSNQRYVLHDLLRQYLYDHCDEPMLRASQAAHCAYFAEYAAAREHGITGHKQSVIWHELDLELPNLRAAWRYALALRNTNAVLRMIESLRLFFQFSGLWEQGLTLFNEARQFAWDAPDGESQWLRTKLVSRLYADEGHVTEYLVAALSAAEAANDAGEVAHVQMELGWRALMDTQHASAVSWFEKASRYYEHRPNAFAMGLLHKGLAYAAIGRFERETARHHMQISLSLRRGVGDLVGEYEMIVLRGEMHLLDGALDTAKQDLSTAFTFFSDTFSHGSALLRVVALGWVYVLLGEWEPAAQHARSLLSLSGDAEFAIVRACGIAMSAFANLIRCEREALERNLDHLTVLSVDSLAWPSTINRDLRFMINLSRAYGHVTLNHWQAANRSLQWIIDDGYMQNKAYLGWLTPLGLILTKAEGNSVGAITRDNTSQLQHTWVELWMASNRISLRTHEIQHPEFAKLAATIAEMLQAQDESTTQ